MKRELQLVQKQPSLRLARFGMFGHFCGLNNIHFFSMFRHDYRMVLIHHGHVCVQEEHTQTELCQASSEPHQSLENRNGQLPDVKAALTSSPPVQVEKPRPRGVN